MVNRATFLLSLVGLVSLPLACGGTDGGNDNGSSGSSGTPTNVGKACVENTECTASKEFCGDDKKCAAIPAGGEIGYRDGSPSSVTITEIYTAKEASELVDLAFNPSDETQIWAVGYADDSTHVGSGVSADANGSWKAYFDPARGHFMHAPPAIAMGAAPFWGTCGDGDDSFAARTPRMFMGPAMFTTDLTIFAKRTGGGLGSHYDMLHSSPFCKGIAHEKENVYWLYNGHNKAIDRIDFHKDHGPGADDHSDGEVWRYADGELTPVDKTPSHVVFDPSDNTLYIADTGASRIAKLDTTTGSKKAGPTANVRDSSGALKIGANEPLVASGFMTNTTLADVGATGLKKPSGIEIKGDLLYVTDTETSTFHVFEKATGKEVRKLKTDIAEGGLAGFTFGPDGKIWFTDRKTNRVLRIDPK